MPRSRFSPDSDFRSPIDGLCGSGLRRIRGGGGANQPRGSRRVSLRTGGSAGRCGIRSRGVERPGLDRRRWADSTAADRGGCGRRADDRPNRGAPGGTLRRGPVAGSADFGRRRGIRQPAGQRPRRCQAAGRAATAGFAQAVGRDRHGRRAFRAGWRADLNSASGSGRFGAAAGDCRARQADARVGLGLGTQPVDTASRHGSSGDGRAGLRVGVGESAGRLPDQGSRADHGVAGDVPGGGLEADCNGRKSSAASTRPRSPFPSKT